MTSAEAAFYKQLYKLVSSIDFALLANYGKMKQDQEIKLIRSKCEPYEHGYYNGKADVWEHIINLKDHVTKVMQNIT